MNERQAGALRDTLEVAAVAAAAGVCARGDLGEPVLLHAALVAALAWSLRARGAGRSATFGAAFAAALHPVALSIAGGASVTAATPGPGWASVAGAFSHAADAIAVALHPPSWPALAVGGVAPLPPVAAAFAVLAFAWAVALLPSLRLLRVHASVAVLASLGAWITGAPLLPEAAVVAAVGTFAAAAVLATANAAVSVAVPALAALASVALLPSWTDTTSFAAAAGRSRAAGVELALAAGAAARGDGEAQMEALRRALELAPADARVRREAGMAWFARGHWDEAARHLEKAVASSFADDDALRVAAAEAAARAGGAQRARRLLERGVAIHPSSLELRTALADFQREHGEHAAALANLEEAVRGHPDDAAAWRELARLHAAAKRWKDAGECWRRVVTLAPRDAAALAGLAHAMQGEGDEDTARSLYSRSLDVEPRQSAVLLELARLDATPRPAEAATRYEQLRAMSPPSALLAREHGVVLSAAGRDGEAARAFAEALAVDPDDADAAVELAWLLATAPGSTEGEAREALHWARKAAAARAGDASALDTLAAAEAAAGDFAAATRDAERALSLGDSWHDPEWSGAVRARLESYRAGRAWRRQARTDLPVRR